MMLGSDPQSGLNIAKLIAYPGSRERGLKPRAKVPPMELPFSGVKVPWNFCSRERIFNRTFDQHQLELHVVGYSHMHVQQSP